MSEKEKTEKMLGISNEGKSQKIIVTHITIRQSISVLLLRLFILESLAAVGIIAFQSLLNSGNLAWQVNFTVFNIPLFILLVLTKTIVMVYIIISWLEEYYEINPKELIHKKGLIWKKEEKYSLGHLVSLKIEQGIIGRICNYGTLTLFNWSLRKEIRLFLIHNPVKYHHILKNLMVETDEEKQVLREHLIEDEKER